MASNDDSRPEKPLRTLPLATAHASAPASFMPFFGWNIAADFGDWESEFRALQESAGVFDASFLAQIDATGRDCADYLNRRLSQLMLGMSEGECRRAALLDAVGKMEADLEAFARAGSLLLLAAPFDGSKLAALLDRFVFSEDCAFRDVTGSFAILAVTGPRRETVLHSALGKTPIPGSGAVLGYATTAGSIDLMASALFPDSVLVRVSANHANMVHDQLRSVGATSIGWRALDAHRIQRLCPWWGIDLDRDTIPLEADLLDAVHFDKGCYPGQETIAKISNLGHPSRKLVALEIAGREPLGGDSTLTLPDGRAVGRVTSSALLPGAPNRCALGIVKWLQRERGTELRVGGRSALVLGGRTEEAS